MSRRKLPAGTFYRAPTAMLFDERCGLTEIRVVGYIAMHGDDAFPSYDAMARDLNIHKRTVREAVRDAKTHGYLTTQPRIVPGRGYRGLIYTILYPEPGAPVARTRSEEPGAPKTCTRSGGPGAGGASPPGAPPARTELDAWNQTIEGADADAPIGSGGGGRDDAGDRATTSTDAAHERSRPRSLALPRPPAPAVEGEGHEARHEHGVERAAPAVRTMPDTEEPNVDHATAIAKALAGLDINESDWWRAVLHGWRRTGKWDTATLGPAPGKPGCRVPAELLSATTAAQKADATASSGLITVGDMMVRFEESCRQAGLLRAA